ncbi:MAG: carboxypeptidase regulatory-like domain-containing protein [Gemmatimonadota bacterium]|jgi:hypothetical protein
MRMRTSPLALAAAIAVFGPLAAPVSAQSIPGRVVLAGWHEPVPGALVQLLGPDLAPVATVRADSTGRFLFDGVADGEYYLQATLRGTSSAVEGPFRLPGDDLNAGIRLDLPSRLYDRARACLHDSVAAGRPDQGVVAGGPAAVGVLAGVAYDELTATPLPAARVAISWKTADGVENTLRARTDGAGRYVFCRVPARVGLTVRLDVLGRVSAFHEGVRVQPGALARMDLSAQLMADTRVRVLGTTTGGANPDSLATLQGQLLDAATEEPIVDAVIALEGLQRQAVTDHNGYFRITGVPAGQHTFLVTRLGYDWRSEPIDVGPGATVVVELRAKPTAIALEAVVVRVSTPEMRMAKAATQAPRVLAGSLLGSAQERAASLEDVIHLFPSLRIRHGQFETELGIERGTCIESSRALMRYAIPERQTELPWCEMIAIVIDGAPTVRGTEMISMLLLKNVESIEFLPPTGALQYGERAALNGALVIWTRGRGPHRDPGRWPGG